MQRFENRGWQRLLIDLFAVLALAMAAHGQNPQQSKQRAVDPSQWQVRTEDSLVALEQATQRAEAQVQRVGAINQELRAALAAARENPLSAGAKAALLSKALALIDETNSALHEALADEAPVEAAFERDATQLRERADELKREESLIAAQLADGESQTTAAERERQAILAGKAGDLTANYRAYRVAQRKRNYLAKRSRNHAIEVDSNARTAASLERAHERVVDRFLAIGDRVSDLDAVRHTFTVIRDQERARQMCEALDALASRPVCDAELIRSLDEAADVLIEAGKPRPQTVEQQLEAESNETGLQRYRREGLEALRSRTSPQLTGGAEK